MIKGKFVSVVLVAVIIGSVGFFLANKSGSAAVVLEQPLSGQITGGGGIEIFQPSRELPFPFTVDVASQPWEFWINSVAAPTADNEVSQQTGGLLLQAGFITSENDDRKSEIAFRYDTGTEQRRFYPVRSQVYQWPDQGKFNYWRTVWLPLLPGQNLYAQYWYRDDAVAKSKFTTPVTRFLGTVPGLTDERPS